MRHRFPARVALTVAIVALPLTITAFLSSCLSLPVPQYPGAAAFVASELASLAPADEYDYEVVDFTASEEREGAVVASGLQFQSLTRSIGFFRGQRVAGDEAPPDGAFLGSPEHLRLAGTGTVRLPEPATVLGMHVSLTQGDLRDLRWIESGQQAPLTVTGINRRGETTGTVQFSPATALVDPAYAIDTWTWTDLSILGEVAALEMTFESPHAELPVLLIDNFTVSRDFRPDSDYFSVVLLPDISEYSQENTGFLLSQIDSLVGLAGSRGSRLAYVAHLGGLVADSSNEDTWETVSMAFRPLDRAVEYGLTFSGSELDDPEDPALGSLLFPEYFPPERIRGASRDSGLSEDGYSWYKFVDVPTGRVLFMHLMTDAPGDTVRWAQQILDSNRDTPTIVVTPSYMSLRDGTASRTSAPVLSGPVGEEEPWISRSGIQIWEELVWPNPQIFLVASGEGGGGATTISWNRADKPVIEMLMDYDDRPAGGEGYLRLLRFYPNRNEMRALTYSPYLDTWEQDPNSSFTVPLDISGRLGLD